MGASWAKARASRKEMDKSKVARELLANKDESLTFSKILDSGVAAHSFRSDSHHAKNPLYERAQKHLIDVLPLEGEDKKIEWKREIIHKFYSKALGWRAGSVSMKTKGKWMKVWALVLSALVPFMISVTLIIDSKVAIKWLDVTAIVLSILAMVLTTIIEQFKWVRKGQVQERTAEEMMMLINSYVTLSGPMFAKEATLADKITVKDLHNVPQWMLQAADKTYDEREKEDDGDHGGENFKKFCKAFNDVEQQGIEALGGLFDVPDIFNKNPVGTPVTN
jgi:hypothetical protein